jgi:prepilin-type processing-associated H-X9-DG protein
MYCDALDWQINGQRTSKWLGSDAQHAIYRSGSSWSSGWNGCMSFRHSSGRVMNASFYDGHAEGVRPEDALNNQEMWVLQP